MDTGKRVVGAETTQIHFSPLPPAAVDEVLACPELMHCAGALMIEHPALAPHILRVDGGLDAVMGLSISTVQRLLGELSGAPTPAEGLPEERPVPTPASFQTVLAHIVTASNLCPFPPMSIPGANPWNGTRPLNLRSGPLPLTPFLILIISSQSKSTAAQPAMCFQRAA